MLRSSIIIALGLLASLVAPEKKYASINEVFPNGFNEEQLSMFSMQPEDKVAYAIKKQGKVIGKKEVSMRKLTMKRQNTVLFEFEVTQVGDMPSVYAFNDFSYKTVIDINFNLLYAEFKGYTSQRTFEIKHKFTGSHIEVSEKKGKTLRYPWVKENVWIQEDMIGLYLIQNSPEIGKTATVKTFLDSIKRMHETEIKYQANNGSSQLYVVSFPGNIDTPIRKYLVNKTTGRIYSVQVGEFEISIAQKGELAVIEKEFKRNGRRVPFVIPMTPQIKTKIGGGDQIEEGEILSAVQINTMIAVAERALYDMKVNQNDNELMVTKYTMIGNIDEKIHKSAPPDDFAARERIQKIIDEAQSIWDPIKVHETEAMRLFQQIAVFFEYKRYESCQEKCRALNDYITQIDLEKIEIEYPEIVENLKSLKDQADIFNKRSQIRLEFENKSINITGILYVLNPVTLELDYNLQLLGIDDNFNALVRVYESNSETIINDKAYKEGDAIKAFPDVHIIKIHKQQVEFEYKGESIKLRIGQKSEREGVLGFSSPQDKSAKSIQQPLKNNIPPNMPK